MKHLAFLSAFLLLCSHGIRHAGNIAPDCTYNGIPLHGKVKVVEHFEDLKVKPVQHFANSCGQWQFVDNFEDFKVKFVDHFEGMQLR